MLTNFGAYVANSRKAIIQFLTLVITLGTAALTFSDLNPKAAAIITSVVGAAGTVLHYATGNAPAPGTVEASGTGEPGDPYVITDLEDSDETEDDDLPEFSPQELITQLAGDEPTLENGTAVGKHAAPEGADLTK